MLGNSFASPTSLPAYVQPLHAPAAAASAGTSAAGAAAAVHDLLDGAAGEEWIGGEDGVGLYHGWVAWAIPCK